MKQESSLYIGHVFHERHQPFNHKFRYRVFTLWLDIDELPALSKRLKFFKFNRFGVTAIHNKDHGKRDGSGIRSWIEAAAKKKKINIKGGKIFILAFPRLWGYVFNPLTIFYCYDKNGVLKAIMHQVKNTFGEQHSYLLPVAPEGKKIKQQADKIFHVSPFIHMDCEYNFRLSEPCKTLNIGIHQFLKPPTGKGKILTATWNGKRRPLNDKEILKALITHPLMSFKIITAIHWEAFWLWLKGAKYIPNPGGPKKNVS